ncbi:DEAD/DEAH box helicase [bacterium]|nr:DEAD/DEAH box helicase [bacterium]MBU1956970.1 DEAD/DEAH box helicase [bacterium]
MQQKELYQRLQALEQQKQNIENEIYHLKQSIEKLSPFTKTQKVQLFKSLFVTRDDVYATHWVSKDGSKKGYAPATYTFRGNDYIPINDEIIQRHLEGKIRLGSYAIVSQVMSKFLVIDLDKASFIEDSRAIYKICQELKLNPLIEISKSGNGIHIWFFFDTLVRASDARRLGDILITKAMNIASGIDMNSYDRLFPTQDFVAPDALGNLVALPLHFGSRQENKTVFIDIQTLQPFDEQWQILQNIQKITAKQLSTLITNHIISNPNRDETLMPWEIKEVKPTLFPKRVKATLFDALHIEKLELSKALLSKLQRFSSFYNPEFYIRQNLRKSTYNIPRVISLYEQNERYVILPRGLTKKVKSYFRANGVEFIIEDRRITNKIKKPNFSLMLKDEQKEAFSAIMKNNYALLIAPPGFGKTAVASAIIAKRAINTLILIHKTTLLEQWAERLSEYFSVDIKTVGMLGKGKKRITSNIDIATLQSLKNRPEMIENYTQIIVDEVHHIPAVSFEIPLKRFRGKYIVGLSATPKRKDGMHPIMFMLCGEIAYELKAKKRPIHQLKTVNTSFDTFQDSFAEILNEIMEDEDRNKLIVEEILKLKDRNILVLSERIEHLNMLYHYLDAKKINSLLLHGGLSHKVQKKALKDAPNHSIILSTSSYVGEGIDFPHLDTIVFTMPISYVGRIVQYLGRVGRRGQKCLAIDFVDENVAMLKSSLGKRLKGYKEMGYQVKDENRLF